MKRPANPRPLAVGVPTIRPRAYQCLLAQDDLDAAEDDLYEKRLLALEWMRMKGIEILGREHEQD